MAAAAAASKLVAAVQQLALAALLHDRLAEASPAAAGGVYGWCFRVAAAAAVRATAAACAFLATMQQPRLQGTWPSAWEHGEGGRWVVVVVCM